MSSRYYNIPDVRDGLTEVERTLLHVLHEARREYGDRMIPTTLIYGRVVELLDLSWEEFNRAYARTAQLSLGEDGGASPLAPRPGRE
jgi:hypothetical protein